MRRACPAHRVLSWQAQTPAANPRTTLRFAPATRPSWQARPHRALQIGSRKSLRAEVKPAATRPSWQAAARTAAPQRSPVAVDPDRVASTDYAQPPAGGAGDTRSNIQDADASTRLARAAGSPGSPRRSTAFASANAAAARADTAPRRKRVDRDFGGGASRPCGTPHTPALTSTPLSPAALKRVRGTGLISNSTPTPLKRRSTSSLARRPRPSMPQVAVEINSPPCRSTLPA